MASLQHVFRRGHIFWWRRVHYSFHTKPIDVRLSLGTPDRLQARNRGAVLTASYDRVVSMLNDRIRANGGMTERELQAIAKAMYEERLAEVCTEQRATPDDAEYHLATNRAFVDYFQRLTSRGGHMSFLPEEQSALEAQGWDAQRIADLQTVIALRENKGVNPIRKDEIDRHLAAAGFAIDDRLRWMVELALYPTYRDVYADAEKQLRTLVDPVDEAEAPLPTSTATPVPANDISATGAGSVSVVPPAWAHCGPVEAAERMIAETPKLLDHRRQGKRARESVDEHTLRQILWAATLLQKSLPSGTPLWKVTKADILKLDEYFDRLPVHYGKSPRHRGVAQTLEEAVALAEEDVAAKKLKADRIGFSTGTTNKHFHKLAQVHAFMRSQVPSAPVIDFSEFTTAIDEDEREARKRYTREQGVALFRLPPWTGCAGTGDRLEQGEIVIHDGLFYLLLLVWYTGARREELCKLMIEDVEHRHGIDYLLIRATDAGRVKNKSARRVNVIADELVRLGFLRYVDAMRVAGERLLFPELVPGGDTKRKLGDVFYKLWWIYIAPKLPNLEPGQAMHSARHMVSDELKDQEVFLEFRNDHLGHRGKGGEGETRYPSAASLQRLKSVVEKIPIVTGHLLEQRVITLLPADLRKPRPTRRAGQGNDTVT
ncbi:hypothetical protein ACFQ15_12650 [Sphingomonas hankookensis]|uniref:hypothetical protein n=1 Tax=Sphingomonas hankookensis TaxID=563996 RepID=UPI001F56B2F7|nr:hypothetical protein [Sphingomonas hankookensis]